MARSARKRAKHQENVESDDEPEMPPETNRNGANLHELIEKNLLISSGERICEIMTGNYTQYVEEPYVELMEPGEGEESIEEAIEESIEEIVHDEVVASKPKRGRKRKMVQQIDSEKQKEFSSSANAVMACRIDENTRALYSSKIKQMVSYC